MPSDEARLAELERRLSEIADLGSAGAVLGWDQATYMPAGGAAGRSPRRASSAGVTSTAGGSLPSPGTR